MNTLIQYLYRDASNYKQVNECVIEGEITEEQKKIILNSLYDGELFVPNVVGMPEERFGSLTEDDHAFFELCENDFSPTERNANVPVTAGELASRFAEAAANNMWEKAAEEFPTGSFNKVLCQVCHIGFTNPDNSLGDETEFDTVDVNEALRLFRDFCAENGWPYLPIDYIEFAN